MVANVLIKFGWHQMENVGGEAFWNFQPHIYGPVLRKISNCHRIFKFWQIAKTVIAYIRPWLWYFMWSLAEIWWKLLKEWCFENHIENFAKCTQWPQTKLKESGIKNTFHIYVHCSTPSPKFSSISLYGQLFFEIFHILGFPIDSHVKISKCHKIFNLRQIAKYS